MNGHFLEFIQHSQSLKLHIWSLVFIHDDWEKDSFLLLNLMLWTFHKFGSGQRQDRLYHRAKHLAVATSLRAQ